MTDSQAALADLLSEVFKEHVTAVLEAYDEITLEIPPAELLSVAEKLRDDERFAFEQLMDVCGVDYSQYGATEWTTGSATSTGFSRGVEPESAGRLKFGDELDDTDSMRPRFAAVYHLLSLQNNQRVRLRVYADNAEMPIVPSVVSVWASANWFEREAFDLYGILFDGHPDLRRILTDYGFVGHPFRKDFPLVGNVEMRYDEETERVVYEPVQIDPRVLVPRVIRHDHRYDDPADEEVNNA